MTKKNSRNRRHLLKIRAGKGNNGKDLCVYKTTFTVWGKSTSSKAPEKCQVGGRKGTSDPANSAKPFLHQIQKKFQDIKLNDVAIEDYSGNGRNGKDLGVSKTPFTVSGESNSSKTPEKSQVGGRKGINDPANSAKLNLHTIHEKMHDINLSDIQYIRLTPDECLKCTNYSMNCLSPVRDSRELLDESMRSYLEEPIPDLFRETKTFPDFNIRDLYI